MIKQHKAARQYSDQMQCSHCGKAWDVNDPEPPECSDVDVRAKLHVAGLRRIIRSKGGR